MSEGENGNFIGVKAVYDAVLRLEGTVAGIEGRLAVRVDAVDSRVDSVMLKQERLEGRLEGSFGMIKWIGPAGVVALLFGLAKGLGYL